VRRTEADGEQQRGAAGRKLRYFMAKQVLRETDDRLPRVRLAHKREVADEEVSLMGPVPRTRMKPAGTVSRQSAPASETYCSCIVCGQATGDSSMYGRGFCHLHLAMDAGDVCRPCTAPMAAGSVVPAALS